jgi:hypothetical protein
MPLSVSRASNELPEAARSGNIECRRRMLLEHATFVELAARSYLR